MSTVTSFRFVLLLVRFGGLDDEEDSCDKPDGKNISRSESSDSMVNDDGRNAFDNLDRTRTGERQRDRERGLKCGACSSVLLVLVVTPESLAQNGTKFVTFDFVIVSV